MGKKKNKGIAKAKKELKRKEAEDRQEEYDKLTPTQKLKRLDEKLGKGVGAAKERERLKKLIQGKFHRDLIR